MVTSKDIAKRRKLLEINIHRAWNSWLKSYITDQNNIISSTGDRQKDPKVEDIVLLNSIETGFPRGAFVTGVVTGATVHPNTTKVSSVKVRYRKNGSNVEVLKSLTNVRQLEFDEITDIYD